MRSSVSLVGGSRLEDVVRADHVDAHRPDRALEDRVDAGDPRAVDDVRRSAHELHEVIQVEHVRLDEREVRMLAEVEPGQRIAMQVVERDDLVLVDEPPRERRPDEPGAAGDDDSLAAQRHAASLEARFDRAATRVGLFASR